MKMSKTTKYNLRDAVTMLVKRWVLLDSQKIIRMKNIFLLGILFSIYSCSKEKDHQLEERNFIKTELQMIDKNVEEVLTELNLSNKDFTSHNTNQHFDENFALLIDSYSSKVQSKVELINLIREDIENYVGSGTYSDELELSNIYKLQFFVSVIERAPSLSIIKRNSLAPRGCLAGLLGGTITGAAGGCWTGAKIGTALAASPVKGCIAGGIIGGLAGGLLGAAEFCWN
jgi:hypothetical protein